MTDEKLKSYEDKLLELKVSKKKLLADDNVKKYLGIEKELDSSTKEAIVLQGIILKEQ